MPIFFMARPQILLVISSLQYILTMVGKIPKNPHDQPESTVINHYWLVVSTYPSEKYESQLG